MRTGAPWSELPTRYGSKSAVHCRLQAWTDSAVLLTLWRAFLDQIFDQQKVREIGVLPAFQGVYPRWLQRILAI